MNRDVTGEESEAFAKRKRLNDDSENETQFADVNSDIYRLPNEILIAIFDRLPLECLKAIHQTSKRWQQLANYIFLQKYSAMNAFCSNEGKNINIRNGTEVDVFSQFIRRFYIDSQEQLSQFFDKQSNFPQLREILYAGITLENDQIHCMKDALIKMEYLRMHRCQTDENFVANILKYTPNIKDLSMYKSFVTDEWLNGTYPTLERLEYYPYPNHSAVITTILELNPTIRTFATSSHCLWENQYRLKAAKIKLDVLEIYICEDRNHNVIDKLRPICELLKELHAIGIYKRLHCCMVAIETEQEMVNELASLDALDILHHPRPRMIKEEKCHAFSSFRNTKELLFRSINQISDIENVAKNLINLERIGFETISNFNQLMALIKFAVNLTMIRIDHYDLPNFINLFAFNRERAKLPNAKKITLYVKENVYLATKWRLGETDFDLIKLKLLVAPETYGCRHAFTFGFNTL